MAYMTKDGNGPYPCDEGEYCGDFMPGSIAYARGGQTHAEAQREQEEWLSRMRFGCPRSCEVGSSKEMETKGYVGLYLKASRKLFSWETKVPTPDKLKEPGENRR